MGGEDFLSVLDRLRHKSAELKFGWGCRFLFLPPGSLTISWFDLQKGTEPESVSLSNSITAERAPPQLNIFLRLCAHSATIDRRSSQYSSHSSKPVSSHAQRYGYRWVRHEKSMFKLGGKIYANFFSLRIFPYVPGGGVFQVFLLKQDFPSHLVRSLKFTDRSAQKWWPKQKILICVTVLSELSQELFDLKMKMSGLSIFLCKMVQHHMMISDTVSFILAIWEWEWLSSKAKLELLPTEHRLWDLFCIWFLTQHRINGRQDNVLSNPGCPSFFFFLYGFPSIFCKALQFHSYFCLAWRSIVFFFCWDWPKKKRIPVCILLNIQQLSLPRTNRSNSKPQRGCLCVIVEMLLMTT